jgi:hypothetical protein
VLPHLGCWLQGCCNCNMPKTQNGTARDALVFWYEVV